MQQVSTEIAQIIIDSLLRAEADLFIAGSFFPFQFLDLFKDSLVRFSFLNVGYHTVQDSPPVVTSSG
jgi:hypothetical protein